MGEGFSVYLLKVPARQNGHQAEIGAPELQHRRADPRGAVRPKDTQHRHQQAADKEHTVDQKQRPQPSVGPAPRADHQPSRSKLKKRFICRKSSRIRACSVRPSKRTVVSCAREADQQDDGRIHARKHGGDIARGPALRRGKLQEAAHHRHKQHRKSTRFRRNRVLLELVAGLEPATGGCW